jgi:hypothetical protein
LNARHDTSKLKKITSPDGPEKGKTGPFAVRQKGSRKAANDPRWGVNSAVMPHSRVIHIAS